MLKHSTDTTAKSTKCDENRHNRSPHCRRQLFPSPSNHVEPMKSKRLLFLALALLGLFSTQQASAVYNSQTGRWLSRDPAGEPGFELLRAVHSLPSVERGVVLPPTRFFRRESIEQSRVFPLSHSERPLTAAGENNKLASDVLGNPSEVNTYCFVMNIPQAYIDPYGLRSWPFGAGRLCVDKGCKKRWAWYRELRYIPEDPPYVLHNMPEPGYCVDADAIYFPGCAKKIADNASVTIKCECTGTSYTIKYSRWPWWLGSGNEWCVGGTRPEDWPGNVPPYEYPPKG